MQHLCDIDAFIISDTILFNTFLSQVDWISEKANIIVVMEKNSGVYLMLQIHLFDASKVEFLEGRDLKQKLYRKLKLKSCNRP